MTARFSVKDVVLAEAQKRIRPTMRLMNGSPSEPLLASRF